MRRLLGHLTGLFFVCVLLIAGRPAAAFGQSPGQLNGNIYDQTGNPLPGVTVALKGPQTREAQTDSEGRLEFRNLQPGDYDLTAALPGFESIHRVVRIQSDQTSTVSLTMVVAIVEQTMVTAAKVGSLNVQSIPMAVTAITGTEVADADTHTIDQAAAMVPSVTFTQNGTFGQLSIRGIGTNAVNAGSDPSSAMYLDGVYLARPAMAFADFLDLERIEVLRGPQGTLYGRNAVGGAVNLISKPPTNDFEASARVTAGTLDELRAEARASGALKRDRIMGTVAVARGVRDGYVRDLQHPDHPLGGDDVTAARAQLRFVLDRRTDLLLTSDVTDQEGTLLTFNKVLQVKPGFTIDNPSDLRDVRTSTTASSGLLQYGASARLTSALTPTTKLVSLTAFRKLENEFLVDADITELNVLATHNREDQHQFSQEVTLSGEHRRWTWVAGTFFFDESDRQSLWVDQFAATTQVRLEPHVDATSAAIFGQASVALTSRLSATAGLRYTREEKDIDNAGGRYTADAPITQIDGTGYAYSDSIEHSAWTPRFSIDLKLPRKAMTYLSATRGFKSGGFNPSSTQPGRGYAPEWAWSYETGLKTELGGRARVNVAAFDMEYTNLQVQTPIGIGVFDIRNAAAASIRGVEVESDARIWRGLNAGGHFAWLDATYDRYIAVGIGNVIGDVAGRRLNNAPEWSGRLWAEWTGNIGRASGVLSIAAEATAQSTVYYTPFNDSIQRQLPYGLLGARAEYGPSHRRWSVGAYARNVTNTDYIMATFGTAPTAFGGRPGPSRQVGAQFVVRR